MSSYTVDERKEKDGLQKKNDILDTLNLDYEAYCNTLYSFSMGNPSKYLKMKSEAYSKLKQ